MLKVLARRKPNKALEKNKFISLMGTALSKHPEELNKSTAKIVNNK